MDKVNGRTFGSDITGIRDENGDWKVVVKMFERRRIEGQDWEEKEVSTACIDSDFEKAYSVALNSSLEKFNDILEENGGSGMFEDLLDSEEVSIDDAQKLEEVKDSVEE